MWMPELNFNRPDIHRQTCSQVIPFLYFTENFIKLDWVLPCGKWRAVRGGERKTIFTRQEGNFITIIRIIVTSMLIYKGQ